MIYEVTRLSDGHNVAPGDTVYRDRTRVPAEGKLEAVLDADAGPHYARVRVSGQPYAACSWGLIVRKIEESEVPR